MTQVCEHSILINAPPSVVWQALTVPELMKQWMGEPEMTLDVKTDWTVGSPIIVSGFHHAMFVTMGTVLRFEPTQMLRYSHLSSLSRLPDEPANHSIFEFRLAPNDDGTSLTVTLSTFPTEAIFKHLDFYWRGTVGILKQFVESRW